MFLLSRSVGGMMTVEKKRILVVDDNVAMSTVLQYSLARAGFDVSVAGNGREALERTQREAFDLVVTDQQMPEMTGVEFCRGMRSTGIRPDVPVVLLTAKSMELDADRLRDEWGVIAVIGKPFSPSILANSVRRLCEDAAV
jgi:CheY-like chemotaxis protein